MRRSALQVSLLVMIAASSAHAQTTASPAPSSSEALDEIVVTGSNLKSKGAAGIANVRVMTSEDIARSGATSVSTLLQRIPEVGAGGFGENQFNTSSPGSAAISLRGLGANATLVLVNGRRVANAPFARNTSGGSAGGLGTISFVDLNLIPVSAIKKVEILKDGAGAVYGADAVSGVVNLILHRDYNETKVSAYYGNFSGSGLSAPTFRSSLITGASSDRGSIALALNFEKRRRLAYRNLPFAVTSLSTTGNPGTFVVPVGARNPITGAIIAAGASTASRTFYVVPGAASGGVTYSNTASPQNSYDNVGDASVQPSGTRFGVSLNADQEITDRVSGFAEFIGSRVTSQETSTPSSISNLNNIVLPASNPFNPFGVTLSNNAATGQTQIRYRFVEYGPDSADLRTNFYRVVGGLRGKIGKTWDWELAQIWNPARSQVAYSNKPSEALVNTALASTNPQTALNLFTSGAVQNSASVLDSLLPAAVRTAKSKLLSTQVSVNGEVMDLPAGPITVALGAEYRKETFSDVRSQERLLSRGASPAPASGARTTKSAYVEARFPLVSAANEIGILDAAEINLAVRTESFDTASIGSTTKPRVGFSSKLFDGQVAFRASWGQGFRAPSLTELYLPNSAGTLPFTDPLRFNRPGSDPAVDGNVTRFNVTGGNPKLRPEKSENIGVGVGLTPKFLPGLSIDVDYFSIDVKQRIGSPTLDYILNNPTLFPGQINRAAPTVSDIANGLPGVLLGVNQLLSNLGFVKTTGFDVGIQYRFQSARFGAFTLAASETFVDTLRVNLQPNLPSTETIGTYENPGRRGTASVFWAKGPVEIGLTANSVGAFDEKTGSPHPKVGAQTTVNIQSSIDLTKSLRVTAGSNNIFDDAPPFVNSFSSTTGYAERTNSWQPRFLYVEIAKTF